MIRSLGNGDGSGMREPVTASAKTTNATTNEATDATAAEVGAGASEAAPFERALAFASERHAGALRKHTQIPYVTHVVIVAETLAYYYPAERDLVLAGLLHDVVEDTDTTLEEVREGFGRGVADLVAAVTKPEKPEVNVPSTLGDASATKVAVWRAQREAMLAALDRHVDADARANVLRLKAADAMANLRAIHRDLQNPTVGEAVWDRFKVGRDDSLWYYRQVLEHVRGLGEEPLVGELADALAAVEDGGRP